MFNKYKILIVAPSWVGDMVMSQTLFKALKNKYGKNLQLDILANQWASNILTRMPEVDNVIINPFNHKELNIIKRIKLGMQLRKNNYNQSFILPNSFKSAIIPFFAKIPIRTGFIGEFRYGIINQIYRLNKLQLPLMIDRFCALANNGQKPINIDNPSFSVCHKNQTELINRLNISNSMPTIAFCPAAEYGPSKRWHYQKFAELASKLLDNNYQIIILGSVKDYELGEQIIKLNKKSLNIHNLCGKTSLTDTIDLFQLSKYCITNDSGLMHIAAASGCKVIAIYGSTSPNFTPPLSSTAQIMKIDIECSPCFARTCKYNHYNCLNYISPEDVFKKII